MRRTVLKNEFDPSCSFLFVNLGYGDLGEVDLLVSTETTDLEGMKGVDKDGQKRLIVFKEDLFEKKKEMASIADVAPQEVYYVDFKLIEESTYLYPCDDHFKLAVKGLVDLLGSCDSPILSQQKSRYENYLALVYAVSLKGVVFSYTQHSIIKNLLLNSHFSGTGETGNVTTALVEKGFELVEDLVSKNAWEGMSSAWNMGLTNWTSEDGLQYDIEEELTIVKAAPVVITKDKHNDTSEATKQKRAERAFEDRVHELRFPVKLAALAAWKSAKAGKDKEEYFDGVSFEGEYGVEEKKEAMKAWAEAIEVYF